MIQHGTCECGQPTSREIDDDLEPRWKERFMAFPFTCEDCSARATAEREEEDRRREEEDRRYRRLERFERSGLPTSMRDLDWDSLDGGRERAVSAARRWADGSLLGLVLAGSVGVGKTRIAGTAAWQMLDRAPLRWMSAPLLFARLGSGLGSETREKTLAALTGKYPLVLDDLDKVRPTEYGAEHVFLAVDQHVANELPLLVTTNLSVGEIARKFAEPYGEAIASRLAGYCEVVRVDGRDRRLERAA